MSLLLNELYEVEYIFKQCVCVCVCVCNFYLNKLFKLFALLKVIIMIIITQSNLYWICIIYSLNFIGEGEREKETAGDGEQKNKIPKHMNPK